MATPEQSKDVLARITSAAVDDSVSIVSRVAGAPAEVQRAALLETVPFVIAQYADGSAALAADFYDDERDLARAAGYFQADPIVTDRTVKTRRAIAWASEPLFSEMSVTVASRIGEVVQLEVARPYRDTITENRKRDRYAAGWRRIAGDSCAFCRMAADKGAVYKQSTAYFAAHEHCDCTAQPVFKGGEVGQEASAIQYISAKRRRSPAEQARLRDYLATNY